MTASLTVTLDGITPIPPGHVATIKSYLEMTAPPPVRPAPPGVALMPLGGKDAARYRRIFAALGQRWLWWSRLLMTESALADLLELPAIQAFSVRIDGIDAGLFELDLRDPHAPDLAFLGLFDSARGRGIGPWLVGEAGARALAPGVRCMTVNTCTFDDPKALGFYRHNGFKLVRQAIEMVPDPRLSGVLPETAAPHIAILREA